MCNTPTRLGTFGRALGIFVMILTLFTTLQLQTLKPASASEMAALKGTWRTHNGELVNFYSCGSNVCGKLMSVRNGIRKDKNNPNPKLRKRAIKGLTIIRSRKKTGPYKWSGTVYNIRDGKTYRGSLKLVKPALAKLTGCQSGFCQSAYWRKISGTRLTSLSK